MNKLLEVVAVALASVAFALLVAVIVIEWFAGCGETWVQADGSRVQGECVFIGGAKH
jgi:hypothetical protein